MKKMTIWTDGFDVITLVGDITLLMYNPQTQDFMISMSRRKLHCITPTTFDVVSLSHKNQWSWLADVPIQQIDIDGHSIHPTWKPNRYGEPADLNVFQSVQITQTDIVLQVDAKGTPEDVFNRYNPYQTPSSNKLRQLDYHKEYLTEHQYQQMHQQPLPNLDSSTKLFY